VRTEADTVSVHDDIDTMLYASLVELARRTGLLVLEEEAYPELLRARLKRSGV
jgi:hypothetical protein